MICAGQGSNKSNWPTENIKFANEKVSNSSKSLNEILMKFSSSTNSIKLAQTPKKTFRFINSTTQLKLQRKVFLSHFGFYENWWKIVLQLCRALNYSSDTEIRAEKSHFVNSTLPHFMGRCNDARFRFAPFSVIQSFPVSKRISRS